MTAHNIESVTHVLFYKQGNGRQAIRPSHLTESGISGAFRLSYPTVEGTGQVNRLSYATMEGAAQVNGLSNSTAERIGQVNGLSYDTDGTAKQVNGLSHPNEESTRYTNRFGFPTEGPTVGQTNGVARVTNELANRLTFREQGTAQTNALTPIADVGAGQSNKLSRPAEEGAAHANGLSDPGQTTEEDADKTSGQANGVSDPTLGGDQLFNGPRQLTQAGDRRNNGQNHPRCGIDTETIRLGHPSEESAEQPDGFIPPLDGQNGQENRDGTNSRIQETSVDHSSQRPAISGNQAGRLNVSVQETGRSNSHGLLSCYHQIRNNQSMNATSSNSELEQATVHQCSVEEFRQWSQLLSRYVSLTATMISIVCLDLLSPKFFFFYYFFFFCLFIFENRYGFLKTFVIGKAMIHNKSMEVQLSKEL